MEQTAETSNDDNSGKRNGEENFSWEEWTVIEEGKRVKNLESSQPVEHDDGSSSDTSYSEIDNASDAEEARESNRVFSKENLEIRPCERVNCRNEESDGISVITESESDVAFVNENENKIIVYKRIAPRTEENSKKNIFKEVTTYVNLFIACSMIVAIGIGIGMKYNGKYSMSKGIDYTTIKMENDKLMEQMKELSSVKEILEEIKTNVIQQRSHVSSKFQHSMGDESEELPYLKKHLKSLDSSFKNSGTTLFERLQIFLRTICLILEDIRQPEMKNSHESLCGTQSFIADLAGLRILMNNVIDEMDDSTKRTNQQFLENVDLQMRSMSDSLVSDLTRSLDKLNLKNQRKIGKIVYKLNERLCVLRNTMPSDNKVRLSLETNDTFVENCDRIMMRKYDEAKKQKWKSESSIIPKSQIEKKKSKIRRDKIESSDSYEKSRGYESKQQNETESFFEDRKNAWKTRKCYKLHNLVPDSETEEDLCSMLMAPPRSSWKSTKKQTFPKSPEPVEEMKNGKGEIARKESVKELDTLRLKKDQVSSKYSKVKTRKEFDQPKNEPSFSSYEKNSMASQNFNSDIKEKRKFSVKPAVQRLKKRFDQENEEPEKSEEDGNMGKNGNWQFERSRIRDELRKDESTENWYIGRMVNRESSRINQEEAEDPR